MRRQWFRMMLVTLALIAGFAAGTSVATAQDTATPEDDVVASHPAHIHNGTCEELGDIAYPLENVTTEPIDIEATPAGSTEPAEQGLPGDVVARSVTSDIDVSLDELVDGEYAVNVHESEENIENYIACGVIDGDIEDDSLSILLEEVDDSGYTGQATMTDHGDGTTGLTINLLDDDPEAFATPDA